MGKEILNKIRRLNWVLSESTTGNLSYEDLSRILTEIIDANVYILDRAGMVMSVAYNNASDSSTYENEHGVERVPEQDNEKFLATTETTPNLIGDALIPILGADYAQKEKYHTIIPVVCGGERLGTLLLARYVDSFSDEDLALCEYG
ncbi:MAG: GTP-sensing pleiotropic transcriptional regulator CodY, partial [Firmicutes bacterium]|nr:GTP-sensing pleiotropic transcriptional regulator CodY [Bacillota bacterium]